MTEYNINNEDEKMIRRMMQPAKKHAPENMKYRIMHQIETEAAFSKRHQQVPKPESDFSKNYITVFGAMYAVIVFLSLGAYVTGGKNLLLSFHFIGSIVLVTSVFSVFWFISTIDNMIREKKTFKNQV